MKKKHSTADDLLSSLRSLVSFYNMSNQAALTIRTCAEAVELVMKKKQFEYTGERHEVLELWSSVSGTQAYNLAHHEEDVRGLIQTINQQYFTHSGAMEQRFI